MTTELYKDIPVILFETQEQWRAWLHENHDTLPAVWVKIAKKSSGITSINHDQALDEALCYGWIDAIVNSIDETFYVQKFTKRRPKGTWSKRNVAKIAALTAAGKMQPAGLAEVAAAKADGRWDMAYDSPTTMVMPDDFKAALDSNPKAKAFYETLNKTNTYAFLWRIQTAKKPETRASRIDTFISMLLEGKKLH